MAEGNCLALAPVCANCLLAHHVEVSMVDHELGSSADRLLLVEPLIVKWEGCSEADSNNSTSF